MALADGDLVVAGEQIAALVGGQVAFEAGHHLLGRPGDDAALGVDEGRAGQSEEQAGEKGCGTGDDRAQTGCARTEFGGQRGPLSKGRPGNGAEGARPHQSGAALLPIRRRDHYKERGGRIAWGQGWILGSTLGWTWAAKKRRIAIWVPGETTGPLAGASGQRVFTNFNDREESAWEKFNGFCWRPR